MPTKIEWCDETWNPITGCSPVSEGCKNCYAARMAKRLAGRFGYPKDDPFRPGTFHYEKMCYEPDVVMFKPGEKVFVSSMGDLFHENVSLFGEQLNDVFDVIERHQENIFILLTKRPKRMKAFFDDKPFFFEDNPNVWLGVTVENQRTADDRIPILLQIPAAVRFVSVEPMLGPLDLTHCGYGNGAGKYDALSGEFKYGICFTMSQKRESKINWIICGGETGPGARPMHPDWVKKINIQCRASHVPFFLKSWGEWKPIAPLYNDGEYEDELANQNGERIFLDHNGIVWDDMQPPAGTWIMEKVGKKRTGRMLDGVEWSQIPK